MPITPKKTTKLAAFLDKHISAVAHKKTQRQIAAEVGWNRPNMVSMIKRGTTRVPWSSVPALAAAIEADPAELFRLAVEDYWPDAHRAAEHIFGTIVSANERELLEFVRNLCGGFTPSLSEDLKAELERALSKWRAA